MLYQGKPCLPYFPSVVKTVANPNIEIKKLVYIYLLHYAESDPDLALLSVNAIQKSLTDQNPQIRAMALRTMSGMRVPVISQIVSLAIKRGCADLSPHVRKASALAIPKCHRLDASTLPQLLDYLSLLLADKQYFVVGPAVSAFLELCPDRIDLIHKHYRELVRKLVDMDEWSQLATLQLLMNYSRRCFPRRTKRVTKLDGKGFYADEPREEVESGEQALDLDPDLELLLTACKPLLQSRNSAVIVSVVSCFLYLGTPAYLKDAVAPLIALLRGPSDIQQVALDNIVSTALITPNLFVPYASHFLIHSSDPPNVWRLKLELLTIIFPYCGLRLKSIILSELEHFAQGTSTDLIRESVRAIGRCAQSDPRTSTRCFKVLLKQISDNTNNTLLVSEALTVIRHLIQQDPTSHQHTVIRLAKNLDMTTSPEARASIIWLVGEFAGIDAENNIAADVLRILASGFTDESEPAKQQILLLAAKVYLHYLNHQNQTRSNEQHLPASEEQLLQSEANSPQQQKSSREDHPIPLLYHYILLLTRYDTSYDLRDRARTLKALLSTPTSTQLASLVLLAPKPVPAAPSPSESRRGLMLGSMTLTVGREMAGHAGLTGYQDLPEWVVEGEEPDARLRDVEGGDGVAGLEMGKGRLTAARMLDEALRKEAKGAAAAMVGAGRTGTASAAAAAAAGKEKSLDAWLDESDGEEEDGETGSESETETETESGSGSDADEDEDEDAGNDDDNRETSERKSDEELLPPTE
jgi:AP-3 complex subunit beta